MLRGPGVVIVHDEKGLGAALLVAQHCMPLASLNCMFTLQRCIYSKGRVTETETSSIWLFTAQMAGPSRNREPRTPSEFSTSMQGAYALERSSTAFPGALSGSCIKPGTVRTQTGTLIWGESIASSDLTHYATVLAPELSST